MKSPKILMYVLVLSLTLSLCGIAGVANAVSVKKIYSASNDFGTTQGQNQWSYQKLSGTVYTDLVYNATNQHWEQADTGYPWISKDAQHPNLDFDPVRKWVSPGTGTITISGTVQKGDNAGDGVVATIKKDNTVLWSASVKTTSAVAPTNVTDIPVVAGTAIYFIVNKNATMSNDHTLWDPTVTYTTEQADVPASQAKPAVTEPTTLSVLSCGAVADDGKDDYAAFAACLDKAKTQGKSVEVPAGTFHLSKILTLDGVSLNGAGKTLTTLVSTDPQNGSIDLKGNGVKLSNLKHIYNTVVPRGNGANEKNSITVRGATNFTVDNVYVYKSSTAGILVQGAAANGKITNNTVESTGADGIHITDSSHDINIENNLVKGVGDDTIAVVSYKQDGPAVHDVNIKNNDVGYNSLARGITVVGGTDVLIEGNSVKDTQMAGIYIAVEGNYNTTDVNRITVNKNTVDHAGIHEPENHPNVLVYASQGVINNVTFSNNLIKNAAHRGIGVWGTGTIKDIYYTGNTLINKVGAATTFTSGTIHLLDNIGF